MTLRTPRRRISPRAKRRYRAIREFFRRALGSSQNNIKINSSIAVNVTDLKHKVVGIEQQLHKHCRDLARVESSYRKETEELRASKSRDDTETVDNDEQLSQSENFKHDRSSGTKILYRFEHGTESSAEKSFSDDVYAEEQVKNYRRMNTSSTLDNYHTQLAKQKKKSKHEARQRLSSECYPKTEHHKNHNVAEHVDFYGMSNSELVTYGKSTPQNDRSSTPRRRSPTAHERSRTSRSRPFSPLETLSSKYDRSTPLHQARTFHCDRSIPRHGRITPQHESKRSRCRYEEQYSTQHEYLKPDYKEHREKKHKEKKKRHSPTRCFEEHKRNRKLKQESPSLDQDFITEIIQRQYQPVKLFGRKGSNMSQFSAPVCRDQEYPIRENIKQGAELCSCCYDNHSNKLYDMRSVCDTRLYSSKRASRSRRHRRPEDIYNDAAYYDVIPVKEKTSPKSRRKFVEEHVFGPQYREVPPSPRTHRPRLNLKAQHFTEYDDYMVQTRHPKKIMSRSKRQEYYEEADSDSASDEAPVMHRKKRASPVKSFIETQPQVHQEPSNASPLHYSNYPADQSHVVGTDIIPNKTREIDTSDKTDKALCEIKDILQNFLQEIKKDNTKPQPRVDKQTSSLLTETHNSSIPVNCSQNYNGQCSASPAFVPPFPSPCCYPLVYPVNYVPNGFAAPSQSVMACHNCASSTKDSVCPDCLKPKDQGHKMNEEDAKNNEIDNLLKEIYKYVAQKKTPQKNQGNAKRNERAEARDNDTERYKVLTSRSVGESLKISHHDMKVGTRPLKCFSKSCEAIGSRLHSDNAYCTSTQSDTVLERLSLEVTTDSSTRLSTISITQDKNTIGKLAKVLKTIGFKKTKKGSRDNLLDADMGTGKEAKAKSKRRASPPPLYGQELMNYTMYGQDFYHRPPMPHYRHPEYGGLPRDPRAQYYEVPTTSSDYTPHRVHQQTIYEHAPSAHYDLPSMPPFSSSYDPYGPRGYASPVPDVCFKEIEVKSIATQSEKKFTIFKKLPNNPPRRATERSVENNTSNSLQTASPPPKNHFSRSPQPKPGFFSAYRNLPSKPDSSQKICDDKHPFFFGLSEHKKLAQGDMKLRNLMLKKIFQKRNPFSPHNTILRTLLGKDRASFGVPPSELLKRPPRMFM